MKAKLLLAIYIFLSAIAFGQNETSERISTLTKYLYKQPNKKQTEQVEKSLVTDDSLEYSLAISILFKYNPKEYKIQMMDAFEIPYNDSRRATVKKFYTTEEVAEIQQEIANSFADKYKLTESEINKINMLYTFLEFRKRNVWTYKTEKFAEPTTIALRGGYLRGLLNESMDYKSFIAEMIERTNTEYEKKTKANN